MADVGLNEGNSSLGFEHFYSDPFLGHQLLQKLCKAPCRVMALNRIDINSRTWGSGWKLPNGQALTSTGFPLTYILTPSETQDTPLGGFTGAEKREG